MILEYGSGALAVAASPAVAGRPEPLVGNGRHVARQHSQQAQPLSPQHRLHPRPRRQLRPRPNRPRYAVWPPFETETLPLRDVDFRRGADGTGRVVVSLPSNQVGVDIRQQGQTLVVEFLRSTLPEQLRRRLDVTDFGTPVNTVSSFQNGDRVRMVVEPTGAWEHSAYQTDNQFVLEVLAAQDGPPQAHPGPGLPGEKLSLNFQNIEVRSLLQVIADFTNFNIVTSDTVSGSLTLRLKDVPWDQALDIIMQSKGLGMRRSGNVIWVAPKDELVAKETANLEAGKKKTAWSHCARRLSS